MMEGKGETKFKRYDRKFPKIAFRVSREEKEKLEEIVKETGLPQAEFWRGLAREIISRKYSPKVEKAPLQTRKKANKRE